MQLTEEQKRLINYRESASFAYRHELTKPFGTLDTVLDWCKDQLTGDWRWQLIDVSTDQRPGRYVFYFDSERDCVAFVLHWS
jgi:hypothetical protein